MKKIGFVIPWYSENIPGGAEMELRGLTTHLHAVGTEIEILTTCVKEFASDWNVNYYPEGQSTVHGFPIRRFKVRKRNVEAFDAVNYKLMNGGQITPEEEQIFLEESVNSPALYQYIDDHKDEYSVFVFIPYMFGVTYYGMQICPEKSVMIPCFHDEAYVYLKLFKEKFPKAAGMVFNAEPEAALAERVFEFSKSGTKTITMGIGMDTDICTYPDDFKRKFGIDSPFILYAGRKDKGKNVHLLVQYFSEYLKRRDTDLKLVLIGGGNIELPKELVDNKRIVDLGFVDIQDKYNAYGAATLLCQPSDFESFSLVIMESWLCLRPVMVSERCAVTRHFASDSNGGLYFGNYFEFEGCLDYIVKNPDIADMMGKNGREYVCSHFSWDVIIDTYMKFFRDIAEGKAQGLEGNENA
ncbi:MAG: glycosyltransferase family 4 protein [Clostridia bacterium]|nr:glycosyltransferase family 4 protein [Clostridia bacterium]